MSSPSLPALALAWLTICGLLHAQNPTPAHVVIPFLANASKPSALDYEGAECEVNRPGTTLRCEFEQVFLTTSPIAADTCLVTTNRYARTFSRGGEGRWVSSDAPAGACGIVETTTLQDGGGVRWTMETKKVATRKNAGASCAAAAEPPEILSWQNLRRPLPCKFIQPGGLSR